MNKMKRLHINLQPESVEKKKTEFKMQAFKNAILAEAILLSIILAINILLSLQISGFKSRLSLIDKEWKSTEPLLKERDYLLQWKAGYLEVFGFLKGIFKRDLSWYAILKNFSSLLPEEMWFKEMSLKEVGSSRVLEIKASVGYLDNDEDKLNKINSFIEAAKKDSAISKDFEVPDLQDVAKIKVKDEDMLDLKFSLSLKSGQ